MIEAPGVKFECVIGTTFVVAVTFDAGLVYKAVIVPFDFDMGGNLGVAIEALAVWNTPTQFVTVRAATVLKVFVPNHQRPRGKQLVKDAFHVSCLTLPLS